MGRWLIFPLLMKELRSIRYLFRDKTAPLKLYKKVVNPPNSKEESIALKQVTATPHFAPKR